MAKDFEQETVYYTSIISSLVKRNVLLLKMCREIIQNVINEFIYFGVMMRTSGVWYTIDSEALKEKFDKSMYKQYTGFSINMRMLEHSLHDNPHSRKMNDFDVWIATRNNEWKGFLVYN